MRPSLMRLKPIKYRPFPRSRWCGTIRPAARARLHTGAILTNSSKLKVAIVGTGLIATKKHLPAFAKLKSACDVVAVCDANLDAAKAIARPFSVSHATATWRRC